jgi:F-type H+-transporting ATPase subunit beta
LSADDRLIVRRARRLIRFLTQPLMVTEAFTGCKGCTISPATTVAGCRAILQGDGDDISEEAFYMIGSFDDAVAKDRAGSQP